MKKKYHALCNRCEHRIKFIETGMRPRYECGELPFVDDDGEVHNSAKVGCYMYQPVKPVVLAVDEGDDRPQFAGAMISARSHGVEIADMDLNVYSTENGNVLFWDKKNR